MRLTVHIPDDLGDILRAEAANAGVSVSSMAAEALDSYLKRKKKAEAGGRLLALIGRSKVADDALDQLELGRIDDRS